MKRLASWPISAAVALGLACVLGASCTSHGEGGRCDPGNVVNNQFVDCDNGLTCVSGATVSLPDGGHAPSDVFFCCPLNRTSLPAGDVCALNPTAPGSDASISDGTLGSDAPPDQTASDVTTDTPADTTQDVIETDAGDASGE